MAKKSRITICAEIQDWLKSIYPNDFVPICELNRSRYYATLRIGDMMIWGSEMGYNEDGVGDDSDENDDSDDSEHALTLERVQKAYLKLVREIAEPVLIDNSLEAMMQTATDRHKDFSFIASSKAWYWRDSTDTSVVIGPFATFFAALTDALSVPVEVKEESQCSGEK